MKILVTGGAGYIGSHIVKAFQSKNFEVTVLDNFSTGNLWSIKNCEILNIDLCNRILLKKKLKNRKFDFVIHLAAKSDIEESISNPKYYYRNNVIGSLNLINTMIDNDINNIIFSSSASIYGNTKNIKIDESSEKLPINPYGSTKLIIENFIRNLSYSYGFNSISLRFFNVAGANIANKIGEFREKETHLIPLLLNSILLNKKFKIYGDKYNTKDGTCIRDYLHIDDLVDAHFKCIAYIKQHNKYREFNLGSGKGFSIFEIINAIEKITNSNIKFSVVEPRVGDPAMLIAEIQRAKEELNWIPKNDLNSIILSSWEWQKLCTSSNDFFR